jgi:Cdc6-like AAA superfamily ATPase
MSNPKDWFRRRPHDAARLIGEGDDPFAKDAVLELGRSASVIPLGRVEPLAFAADKPRMAGDDRVTIPPPPRRATGLRSARIIESRAFAVRPEIAKAAVTREPAPVAAPAQLAEERRTHEPRPAAPALLAEERKSRDPAGGAPQTRAVPLVRPVRPAAASGSAAASKPPSLPPLRSDPAPSERKREERPTGEMPGFTLAAPGVPWLRQRGAGDGAGHAALREAFTPTRPKQQGGAFFGRYAQMQRIIAAIEEERAHVVLYGERGSGKTSLANIIAAKADEAGYLVLKFACSSAVTFEDLFRSLLRRIPATFLADGVGATSRAGISNFEELLPPGEIGVAELAGVFARLHDKHVILVIDEYDRVTNATTKNKLAELIKNMSDASAPVTLLLIGVAEDVDELLGKHPSLQRTLVTLPLPLMAEREIDGIIAGGEERSGLSFAPGVRQRIVELAQGLPYHAQLLSLFAARSALRRHSPAVEREDLRYAVLRVAEEAENRVKEAYALAAASPQGGTAFKDVLFAAARCRSDAFGTFTVAGVAEAAAAHGISLSTLSLQYPLKKLTEAARGQMLRRLNGLDGLRYQFTSQMLRHHVLIRQAVERGLV